MKKFLLSLGLLVGSLVGLGQVSQAQQNYNFNIGGLGFASGSSVPGACTTDGYLFWLNTGSKAWYVCANGTYSPIGNTGSSGTVTSVAVAASGGLQVTGTPTVAPVLGLINCSVGNVLQSTGVSTWGCSAAGSGTVTNFTAGTLSPLFTTSVATATTTPALTFTLSNAGADTVLGSVAGGAPTYFTPVLASALFTNQGTTTTVLHGNAAGNPAFGAVVLTTDVSGVLPTANGGSGTGGALTGLVRGGNPFTAAELSGQATTSGSNVVTVTGLQFGATAFTFSATAPTTGQCLYAATASTIGGQACGSGSLPSGTQGQTLVNTTGSNVYATTPTLGIDLAQYASTIPFTTGATTPTVDVTTAFNALIASVPVGTRIIFPPNSHYKFSPVAGAQFAVPVQKNGLVFACGGGPGGQYTAALVTAECSVHMATPGGYVFGVGQYGNSSLPTSGPQFINMTFVDDTPHSNAGGQIYAADANNVLVDNATVFGGWRQSAVTPPSAPTCSIVAGGSITQPVAVQTKIQAWTTSGPSKASAAGSCGSTSSGNQSVSVVIPSAVAPIIGYEVLLSINGGTSFVTASPLPTYTVNGDGSETINLQTTTPLVITANPTSTRQGVAIDLSHTGGMSFNGSIGWAGSSGFSNGPRVTNLKSYLVQGAVVAGIGAASVNVDKAEVSACDVVVATGACGAGSATPGLLIGFAGFRGTNIHATGFTANPSSGPVATFTGFDNTLIGGTFQSNTGASTEIGVSLVSATRNVVKGLITANYATAYTADANSVNNQVDAGDNTSNAVLYTDAGTGNQWLHEGGEFVLSASVASLNNIAAGEASLVIPPGVTPNTPKSGAIWNASGILKLFDGTNTQSEATISSASAVTSGQVPQFSGTTGLLINSGVLASSLFTNPMTTLGDVIYGGASGTATRLAGPTGVNGVPQVLISTPSGGVATAPVWAPGGVPTNAQTGTTYTVLATDRTSYVSTSNAGAIATTLPQAGTSGFASNDSFITCDIGAGTNTITPTTSTISYSTGGAYTAAASTLALTTGQCAFVYSDNTNYFAVKLGGGGGSGTVTSVAETVPSGFAVSGSPITVSGTLGITYSVSGAGQIINSSGSNTAGFTATPTISGLTTFSGVGAASTPGVTITGNAFTGGSGTTTVPQVYINNGATGPTTFNTSGTQFGINATSGFAGNFFDFYVNGGSSLASLTAGGLFKGTFGIGATAHGVIVSEGLTTAAVATAVGATNQVLNGNTGADPTWGAVPLAALPNIPINNVVSATGAIATVADGNNPLVINCALTSGTTCLTTGETTAATTVGAVEHQITTLTTTTAIPLQITQGAAGPANANAANVITVSAASAGGAAGASNAGSNGAGYTFAIGAGSNGGATTGIGGVGGVWTVSGAVGGNAGGTATNNGGNGSSVSWTTGAGGNGGTGVATAGSGGGFVITLGAPGTNSATGTAGAVGQFQVTGNSPASTANTAGVNAGTIFLISGVTGGGDSNAAGTAGIGSTVSINSGNGGAGTSTNTVGGAGGPLNVVTGNGGASAGTGANANGGNFNITLGKAGIGGSGTVGVTGQFNVAGTAIVSTANAAGLAAGTLFNVSGLTGGATSNAAGTAGIGSLIVLNGGTGGAGTGTNAVGGAGGTVTLTGGNGGASAGTGANSNGGNIVLTPGSPGTGGSGAAGSTGNVQVTTGAVQIGTATCIVFGTAGGICPAEGTAPTNVAGAAPLYPDSTKHEFLAATNGSASFGMINRTQPGAIRSTGLTASVSTATLCAAAAGACNQAGTYRVNVAMYQSGSACTANTTNGVSFALTWTDGNGTAHSAQTIPIITNGSLTAFATSGVMAWGATTLGAWGSGDVTIDTNGTIIQYATTYATCTTGTATYAVSAAAVRVQ